VIASRNRTIEILLHTPPLEVLLKHNQKFICGILFLGLEEVDNCRRSIHTRGSIFSRQVSKVEKIKRRGQGKAQ
jgi:hypothetical protein